MRRIIHTTSNNSINLSSLEYSVNTHCVIYPHSGKDLGLCQRRLTEIRTVSKSMTNSLTDTMFKRIVQNCTL